MVHYLGITSWFYTMNMPYTSNENVGKVRLQAIRMLQEGKSTREVARYFGYAQSTIVKWNKRRNEVWHRRGLPTLSSRPRFSPNRTSQELEAKILLVRKETKRCAEVIHETLKAKGLVVSLTTVKRVLKRYGVTKERSKWKKRRIYTHYVQILQYKEIWWNSIQYIFTTVKE